MDDLEKLMKEIEELRAQLNYQGKCRGLQDDDVLKKSKLLDNLINQYYKLTRTKPCKKRC